MQADAGGAGALEPARDTGCTSHRFVLTRTSTGAAEVWGYITRVPQRGVLTFMNGPTSAYRGRPQALPPLSVSTVQRSEAECTPQGGDVARYAPVDLNGRYTSATLFCDHVSVA